MNEQLPSDSLSSTPRTDAEHSRADEYYEGTRVVTADFARQLERELNDVRGALRAARPYVERYEPKDVSEAHDRDLLLTSIEALQE